MIHKPSQDPKVTNRKLKAPAHNDEILSDFPHSERSGDIGIRILSQNSGARVNQTTGCYA